MKRDELQNALISVISGFSMLTADTSTKFAVLMTGFYKFRKLPQAEETAKRCGSFSVEVMKITEAFTEHDMGEEDNYYVYNDVMRFILNSDTYVPLVNEMIAEFKEQFKDLGEDES